MNNTRPYCDSFAPGGRLADGRVERTGEDCDSLFAYAAYEFSEAPS
jgi:hypothetical protein